MDNFVAKRNTARFSQGVRLASGKFAMLKHGKSQPILCLARGFVNRYAGVGCSARNYRRLVTEGVPNASCVDVWFAMDMAADKPVVGDKKEELCSAWRRSGQDRKCASRTNFRLAWKTEQRRSVGGGDELDE